MMKKWALVLGISVLTSCYTQESMLSKAKKGKSITTRGYLINFYGKYGVWVFQPCANRNTFVIDAINDQSFFVNDMVNDLGLTFLSDSKNTGKKVPVLIYDHTSKVQFTDTIEYIYCKLTIKVIDSPRKVKDCAYTIKYKQVEKELVCWSIENYVTNLEPIYIKL